MTEAITAVRSAIFRIWDGQCNRQRHMWRSIVFYTRGCGLISDARTLAFIVANVRPVDAIY